MKCRISIKLRNKINFFISSVMRVINDAICLITSMITDRIGRHEVLLPINHNFSKICNMIGYFLNQNTRNSKFCFASSDKRDFKIQRRDGNENVA